MIPNNIDGYPVSHLHLTDRTLSEVDGQKYIRLTTHNKKRGKKTRDKIREVAIPTFAFDNDGHIKPRRSTLPSAIPQDRWVFKQLLGSLESAIDYDPDANHHVYLVTSAIDPYEIGIVVMDGALEIPRVQPVFA